MAFIRAFVASLFVFEITGAFALGFATLVLFALHVHGIAFWSVEAITAAATVYVSFLFFLRAFKSEKSMALSPARDTED
ncbi:hypothetical protein WNY37_03150 [Henriciella sp. AS95]|uniref:hypothetical protein n=1 Tax=Henriciella sp. AS95 TaxID=3135782 RepID=UPI00316C0421